VTAVPGGGRAADLDDVLAALRAGAVVAVATDTVYGLVCDPADPAAVQRVYDLKRRPKQLELTLLAGTVAQLDGMVRWSDVARRLAAQFWPGPLSLVLPVGERRLVVPRRGETLSVRVPGHPQLLALLTRSGPLASTSANRHGEPDATTASAVRELFGDDVPLVLGAGRPGGVASTIIDCSVTPPRVLREGPIDQSRLVEFVQG
jgi:tRNA threonylcarbamoyl adenosine modification protein (Sua5/YciO/YrdC/YwlC family)